MKTEQGGGICPKAEKEPNPAGQKEEVKNEKDKNFINSFGNAFKLSTCSIDAARS